jgi:hypothetical protein
MGRTKRRLLKLKLYVRVIPSKIILDDALQERQDKATYSRYLFQRRKNTLVAVVLILTTSVMMVVSLVPTMSMVSTTPVASRVRALRMTPVCI